MRHSDTLILVIGIIVNIILTILFCYDKMNSTQNQTQNQNRIEVISVNHTGYERITVYIDKETGVYYLTNSYGGITPMYDKDGNLLIKN